MSTSDTTIFVVDDDDGVRGLAMTVLQKAGYDVHGFDSIPTALAGLRAGPSPSLILLDGILPGMDAYDFLNAVNTSDDLPAIHVLVMSDMLDLSKIQDGAKVKVLGRLDKPFSPDALMKAVLGALLAVDGE